jgi:hypothetical protein
MDHRCSQITAPFSGNAMTTDGACEASAALLWQNATGTADNNKRSAGRNTEILLPADIRRDGIL